MKKLLTAPITTTASMPIKSGTLDFLQNAYTELIVETVKGLVGKDYSASIPYAITALNNNLTPPNYQIVSGLILYQGILYMSTGGSFTLTGANVAVCTITTTYQTAANADPVEFTDASNHNVHEIQSIDIAQALTGTGTFDYSAIVFIKMGAGTEVTYEAGWDNGGVESVFYRRNRDGFVNVQGRFAANGTPATTDPIFTLPVGYRPLVNTLIHGLMNNGSGDLLVIFTITASTGRVTVGAFSYSNWANNDLFICSLNFYNA